MKIKKVDLLRLIKNIINEDRKKETKTQKVGNKFIPKVVKNSGVIHSDTGFKFTVDENFPEEKIIKLYRYDDKGKIISSTVDYNEFEENYEMV